MNFLDTLIRWLERLTPFCFIRPNQRGVRYLMLPFQGVRVQPLQPGLRLRCLGCAEVEVTDVAEALLEVEPQDLTTSDGKPVHLRMAINVRVTDVVKYQLAVQHTDTSLSNLCEVEVARIVRDYTRTQLRRNLGALEAAVLAVLTQKAERWGVAVAECALTRHSEAVPHRFITDGALRL